MIEIKRAYEPSSRGDGKRYLVDGLWPRGVRKEELEIQEWLKSLAPSDELRRWFGHREERWEEFRERYFEELERKKEFWKPLLEEAREGKITLVYGSKGRLNNARALKEFLESKL